MAGIDILNQFPNSKMAAAVALGQSRLVSGEMTTMTPGQKTGTASLTGVAGNTSTAQLMTLCGVTTAFDVIALVITTSVAGVTISQGGVATKYAQGQTATFYDVSTSTNQLQVLTVTGDVVTINYVGV